ncbi:hypothetical protein ACLBX9_07145 [Methylobacterium sp. A49B]
MLDQESTSNLLKKIERVAADRSIVIPKLTTYPNQQIIYERYLKSVGRSAKDVDKMIDFSKYPDDEKDLYISSLQQVLDNHEKVSDEDLALILQKFRSVFSEESSSLLLRLICKPFIEDPHNNLIGMKDNLAIGVFPFRWFNGQSTRIDNSAICLAATGAIDLIEIFCILFFTSQTDMKYALENMRRAIKFYVENEAVDPVRHDLAKGKYDFSKKPRLDIPLTTAGEQFLLAHELGHAALGHIKSSKMHALPTLKNSGNGAHDESNTFVISPSHYMEYAADMWALDAMLRVGKQAKNYELGPFYCAGASVFLGLALLIESAARSVGAEFDDSHPPALNRLYIIERGLELTGNHKDAFLARRVLEFIEKVGAGFDKFFMPPLMSGSLNSIALEVVENLKIDCSRAPYDLRKYLF